MKDPIDNFEVYERMRIDGLTAKVAYLHAEKVGLDWTARIRMLRAVFRLSLTEVKEVMVTADGSSSSLIEHQQRLIPALREFLRKD